MIVQKKQINNGAVALCPVRCVLHALGVYPLCRVRFCVFYVPAVEYFPCVLCPRTVWRTLWVFGACCLCLLCEVCCEWVMCLRAVRVCRALCAVSGSGDTTVSPSCAPDPPLFYTETLSTAKRYNKQRAYRIRGTRILGCRGTGVRLATALLNQKRGTR